MNDLGEKNHFRVNYVHSKSFFPKDLLIIYLITAK